MDILFKGSQASSVVKQRGIESAKATDMCSDLTALPGEAYYDVWWIQPGLFNSLFTIISIPFLIGVYTPDKAAG